MFDSFTKDDWDRIVFALSHFSHNKDFEGTLRKLLYALDQD